MCVILHSENERSAAVSHFGGHAFSALHHLSPIKTRHTEEGGRRRRVAEIRRVLRKNEAAQDTAALFVVARSIGRPGSLVCARVQNPETRYLINYGFYGLVARMRKIQWMLGSLETQ